MKQKVKVDVKQGQRLVAITCGIGAGANIEGVGDVVVSKIQGNQVVLLITAPTDTAVARIKTRTTLSVA